MKFSRFIHGILIACCFAAVIALASPVQAENQNMENAGAQNSTLSAQHEKELPTFKGFGWVFAGFRYVDGDELSRVSEYEDEESTVTLGIEGIACPLPHRYHIHSEYLGESNYYGDLGYAYRDLLLFRDIFDGVHHNLDHYHYLYPNTQGASYVDRSVADENYIDFYKNDLLLRLKAPDYPFHVFFKNKYVGREGGIEERFWTGSVLNMIKTSQTRTIDWDSQEITLGLNSHLGPVEIEYAYAQADFDPGTDNVLYDHYAFSPVFRRPADIYPHNVIPETESFANSLKFHSSYTGQIVASATFSNTSNKNTYSGTEAENWKAAFDLRWIPDPAVSFFLKYRHNELDKDNPDEVVVKGLIYSETNPVRPLISTRSDLVSLSARYRPLTMLTLIGKYEFELRDRSDVEEWMVLPDSSEVHRINLTAHARPVSELKLKGIYDYITYSDPAYNTEPDDTNKLRFNATYTPLTWLTALFDYTFTLTNRDHIRYYDAIESELYEQGERDGRRDHVLTSLSFVLSPEATVTTSWDYNRWKIEQDLVHSFRNTAGTPYYDLGVPYEDESNAWTLSLYYQLRKDLSLTADIAYIKARGDYQSGVVADDGETSLDTFSNVEYEETLITAELAKKILEDWEVGLKVHCGFYEDDLKNTGPDYQDGELYITTLTLKRYF